MFWGTMSDRWGRRPMFIGCMVVLCGACVGLALVPTNAYWLLMVLRCLQAAGSASTIALGKSNGSLDMRITILSLHSQVLESAQTSPLRPNVGASSAFGTSVPWWALR